MAAAIEYVPTGSVSHIVLTVSDVERSREFYTENLGFKAVMEIPGRGWLISNGSTALILARPPKPRWISLRRDRFDENRVGLDHLGISVSNRDELEKACKLLDERGIPHGDIEDMGPGLRFYGLTLRDPDNTQVELTASYEIGSPAS